MKWTYDNKGRWTSGDYEVVRFQHGPVKVYGAQYRGEYIDHYTTPAAAKECCRAHNYRRTLWTTEHTTAP